MYYKWKEDYNIFGLDGIISRAVRLSYDIKKLNVENVRLKKLLVEKDLENTMLS